MRTYCRLKLDAFPFENLPLTPRQDAVGAAVVLGSSRPLCRVARTERAMWIWAEHQRARRILPIPDNLSSRLAVPHAGTVQENSNFQAGTWQRAANLAKEQWSKSNVRLQDVPWVRWHGVTVGANHAS